MFETHHRQTVPLFYGSVQRVKTFQGTQTLEPVVRVASSRENKGVPPDRSAPNAGPRADHEQREAPRQIEPKLSDQRHLRRVFTDTQRLEQMVRINRTTDHIL